MITLDGSSLSLSRLVFGTAGLFNAGSSARRQDLLAAAVAAGFSHIDTAPLYGYGVAEREVGRLLRADPELTVSTKVGLHGPGGDDQGDLQVMLRKVGGRLLRGLSAPRSDYTLAHARRSLEGSLRRLGRERIDLYLVHQPAFGQLDAAAWTDWLEELRARGTIGAYGIEVSPAGLPAFLAAHSPLAQLVSLEDQLGGPALATLQQHGRVPQLTWGYLQHANGTPEIDVLRHALVRNPHGAVVVDTLQVDTVKACRDLIAAA